MSVERGVNRRIASRRRITSVIGSFGVAVFAAAGMMLTSNSFGAFAAADDASQPAYSGGWTNGSNGGYGFGAWVLNGPSSTSQGGFFIGDSTSNGGGGSGAPGQSLGINTGSAKSFGLYANSGQTAEAIRTLTGALATTDTLSFNTDNGYIANGGADGFVLRAGSTDRLEFRFQGGASGYSYVDGTGTHSTSIVYTDGGLSFAFTPTGATTYQLVVMPNGGSPTTLTGTLNNSPTVADVDTFRAYDFNSQNNSAGDYFVNSLAVVPEPASLAVIAAGSIVLGGRRRQRRAV